MAEVIKHTYLLKRGTAAQWAKLNPILMQGEPGFVYDQNKLKIGDGFTPWSALPYIEGENGVVAVATYDALPRTGSPVVLYIVKDTGTLYQWNGETSEYTPLTQGSVKIDIATEDKPGLVKESDEIKVADDGKMSIGNIPTDKLSPLVNSKKYEILDAIFANTCINYKDNEIRVLFPQDTNWKLQTNGADPNKYYIGFRAYAPEGSVCFKESLDKTITDNTIYYFEGNDFAGKDKYGRQYSIVWLPVASYQDGSWHYYGSNSSEDKYIGWYYTVEWYDKDQILIDTSLIRINLTNEECHNSDKPYYMNTIKTSSLVQDEVIEFYGGSATDVI